jgi:hypothetical protein
MELLEVTGVLERWKVVEPRQVMEQKAELRTEVTELPEVLERWRMGPRRVTELPEVTEVVKPKRGFP